MPKKHIEWDKDLLAEYANSNMSQIEAAKKMNCSVSALQVHLAKFGIEWRNQAKNDYTESDIRFLMANYYAKGSKYCSEHIKHSTSSIRTFVRGNDQIRATKPIKQPKEKVKPEANGRKNNWDKSEWLEPEDIQFLIHDIYKVFPKKSGCSVNYLIEWMRKHRNEYSVLDIERWYFQGYLWFNRKLKAEIGEIVDEY